MMTRRLGAEPNARFARRICRGFDIMSKWLFAIKLLLPVVRHC